jgi:hypothetical protein
MASIEEIKIQIESLRGEIRDDAGLEANMDRLKGIISSYEDLTVVQFEPADRERVVRILHIVSTIRKLINIKEYALAQSFLHSLVRLV